MTPRSDTAIHRRVESLRAGRDPTRVARVSSGWWVLGDPQVISGYCLLLPDPVVPHLNALPPESADRFLSDVAAIGNVILKVCGAERINYAIFGNLEPALHAHLFPRRADEPVALRTAQPWAWDWDAAARFSLSAHGELIARFRETAALMLSDRLI
jgi:diadenosine tetraphosphate (Ap4A) HIT family hydrolase